MSKKQLRKTQAEKETTLGRGAREDTVVTRKLQRKSETPVDGDHAKKCLREFLGSPSYYQDSEGKWRPKKWLPDSPYIKYRKTYTKRFDLPLRLSLIHI